MTSINIILTGFSGTGKSQVGRIVSRLLGWSFLDTDGEISRRTGKTIEAIFRDEGEEAFRKLERIVVSEACLKERQVISTGGGAFSEAANREAMINSGVVVCLEALPETIYRRLVNEKEENAIRVIRPLLEGDDDPLERIRGLKQRRQVDFAHAGWTIHTDRLSLEQVAREVVHAWRTISGQWNGNQNPFCDDPDLAATVDTESGCCPVLVSWGIFEHLGDLLGRAGIAGPVYLISDDRVFEQYGRDAQMSLHRAGIIAHSFTFPSGEESKSLENAQRLYGWLAEKRAERSHTLVSLGGGVTGDLTGFVAATYNRGMGFVQVPTSLAAMVDASIGGKTAVNLPVAKNLVGAFYQPRMVVVDVSLLRTLPRRAIMEGWAEAIKHGLILDAELAERFESHSEALLALEPEITTAVVRRSIAIKASVVSEDERETTGYRMLLNYGHTIGHGLEAATEYGRFLHGEAVSVGMMGAAKIGMSMGVTPLDVVERQESLLRRFNLPLECPDVDMGMVADAMARDKKIHRKSLRWVLLEEVGKAIVRDDVPEALVEDVLRSLTRPL
jgi:shikimate kinase/3-dehydroquinate synthase